MNYKFDFLVGGTRRVSHYCMTTTFPVQRREFLISTTSIVATLSLLLVAPASQAAGHSLADVRELVTPDTTVVMTDAPVDARTRSGPGFNILTD